MNHCIKYASTIKYDHNLKNFKVVFVLASKCQSFRGGNIRSLLNKNASLKAMLERRRPRAYPAPTCVPLPHHCNTNFTTHPLIILVKQCFIATIGRRSHIHKTLLNPKCIEE